EFSAQRAPVRAPRIPHRILAKVLVTKLGELPGDFRAIQPDLPRAKNIHAALEIIAVHLNGRAQVPGAIAGDAPGPLPVVTEHFINKSNLAIFCQPQPQVSILSWIDVLPEPGPRFSEQLPSEHDRGSVKRNEVDRHEGVEIFGAEMKL